MAYLYDWFKELLKLNEINTKEYTHSVFYLAVPTPVVEFIFLICSHFNQPKEVCYLSVELFERFVRQHFLDLYGKVWNDKQLGQDQWKTVEKKLDNQTTLRILSCIQIASKFITHPNLIHSKDVLMFLLGNGKTYILPTILASEKRVWKTLKFNVNIPTILTYAGVLLDHLQSLLNLPIQLSEIHRRATIIIDIVYLHHQEIYRKLFYMSTGRWDPTPTEKREFLFVECNVLYRAAAVVALSLTFTSKEHEMIVYRKISSLTDFSVEDIKALATVIKQIVLS